MEKSFFWPQACIIWVGRYFISCNFKVCLINDDFLLHVCATHIAVKCNGAREARLVVYYLFYFDCFGFACGVATGVTSWSHFLRSVIFIH